VLGTILAVVVGGGLSLLGTLLANYLQYRRERRARERERLRERCAEVRRYVIRLLRLVDLLFDVAEAHEKGEEQKLRRGSSELRQRLDDYWQSWDYSPVEGSPLVMFVYDHELTAILADIDVVSDGVAAAMKEYMEDGVTREHVDKLRDELRDLAEQASRRMDQLEDNV